MRGALEERSGERQLLAVAVPQTIPAPIKGWNLVDPIAKMDPEFATVLDNWIPRPGYCEPRKGLSSFATGFGADEVKSLIPYVGGATRKLFAAAGLGFFDVTAGGAIGAAVRVITTSGGWISQQFTTLAGTYVSAVNGVDAAGKYDGAAWSAQAITVADPTKLLYVTAYQARLWFVEKNTLDAWYLAPGAIEGAATKFPLGTQCRLGGKLLAVCSWSPDAGSGPNDYIIFVTDQGEVIVYQGTNPDLPATFALVGTYRIPKPFGTDPVVRYSSDVLILTQQGVYPVSKALQSATIDRASSLTYSISPQFASDFTLYGANYGWSMCLYTDDNLLIVNVPGADGGEAVQYVMDTLNGAWCRLRNIRANAFCVFGNSLYFAGKGKFGSNIVGKALTGADDYGYAITSSLLTAYSYFDSQAVNKQLKLLRPNLILDASITLGIAVVMDFNPNYDYQSVQKAGLLTATDVGIWDLSKWDAAVWGFASFVPLQWRSVYAAPGFAIAVGLQTKTKNAIVRLASFDLLLEPGGVL